MATHSWHLATAGAFSPTPVSTPLATTSFSFPSSPLPSKRSRIGFNLCAADNTNKNSTPPPHIDIDRRCALQILSTSTFLSSSLAAALILAPRRAEASSSELFRPNPLTNPVLEQLRIWNQDEADNIRYGGELESGSAKPKAFDQYVQLLQPILAVEQDIGDVCRMLDGGNPTNKEEYASLIERVDATMSRPLFDRIEFKKAFNAFADNIYYSDPDRANVYLGGGAVPKTTQSIAYLLRNDVLTNVEDIRAEARYLLREVEKSGDGSEGAGWLPELEDLYGMSRMAREGMMKYLNLVPPKELEAARAKFAAR